MKIKTQNPVRKILFTNHSNRSFHREDGGAWFSETLVCYRNTSIHETEDLNL